MATEHYYVDPINGSDTNVGGQGRSKDLAWQSYQWAADNATTSGSNAYVWFRPGTYTISAFININTNEGSGESDRIYFIGDKYGQIWGTAGTVKIVASGSFTYMMYVNSKDYITIKNFEIIPDQKGIHFQDSDHSIADNCFIHDNVTTGTNSTGIEIVRGISIIKNCIIKNLTAIGSCYGIDVQTGGTCNLYHNLIYNISGNVANNASACIYLYHINTVTPYLNATVIGNICKKTNVQLIICNFYNGTTNATVTSNYNTLDKDGTTPRSVRKGVYSGSWAYTDYANLSDWKGEGTFPVSPDANSIDSDPLIENVSGSTLESFKIKSLSPCINKVPYISDAAADMFGRPRLKGNNDIGAHQYNEIKIS